jgi:hypothetical protein
MTAFVGSRSSVRTTASPLGRHPPRPPLVFAVGVTGHRALNLVSADHPILETRIDGTLQGINRIIDEIYQEAGEGTFDDGGPILRLLSSLADGADQIVATSAGPRFQLQCSLPFPREEYAKDFLEPCTYDLYNRLLAAADSVVELDGRRSSPAFPNASAESYLEAGRMMLRHVDLLVAVWDGEAARDVGGTGQIVEEARRLRMPVVWIRAMPPHDIQFSLRGETFTQDQDGLEREIRRIVLPPGASPHPVAPAEAKRRRAYFAETERRTVLGRMWLLFRAVVGTSPEVLRAARNETVAKHRSSCANDLGSDDLSSPARRAAQPFVEQYAWANHLAAWYGLRHRASVIVNGILVALVVAVALIGGVLNHKWKARWVAVESVFLILIIANIAVDRLLRFHEKWLDYRLLGEHLRQMRLLFFLGRTTPSLRLPSVQSEDDPRQSWIYWVVRMVTRGAGVPQVRFDKPYLAQVQRKFVAGWLGEQIKYHRETSEAFGKLNARLRFTIATLFVVTLVACVSFVAYSYPYLWQPFEEPHGKELSVHGKISLALTCISAWAPAISAALTGILFHVAFERVAKRSHAVASQLEQRSKDLEHAQVAYSSDLIKAIEPVSRATIEEVLDWRILFSDKELEVG